MIFPFVEDYIAFLAGRRDATGSSHHFSWLAISEQPAIKLATYDVGFVTSVADQTLGGIGLSDRQAVLAERLIEKYSRQMYKAGVEQPDHKHYRLPVRVVDRSSKVYIDDDVICFRFPFNSEMISTVKTFAKESQGRTFWDNEHKYWVIGLTEYNLSWVVAFASSKNISVSDEINDLFAQILEVEKTPYAIELRVEDGKAFITNAPDSMVNYLEQHVGFDDLYGLVDHAGILGYTVSDEIVDVIVAEKGKEFFDLCKGQVIDLTPGSDTVAVPKIIEWAVETGRLPICVYNPHLLKPNLSLYQAHFTEGEIQVIGWKDKSTVVDSSAKVVYTNKILSDWQGRMPVLVSYANLMHGVSKQSFLQKAEKVAYLCERLYTK